MKTIMATMPTLLLFSVLIVGSNAVYVTASPKIIRVLQDYQTIQEAINWASWRSGSENHGRRGCGLDHVMCLCNEILRTIL